MRSRKFLNGGLNAIKWVVPKAGSNITYDTIDLDISDECRLINWCLSIDTRNERVRSFQFICKLHDEITNLRANFTKMMPAYAVAEKSIKARRKKFMEKNKKKNKK